MSGYYASARDEMLRFVPADAQRVLEVGCGAGAFAGRLAARGCRVTGIEPAQGPAQEARRLLHAVVNAPVEAALDQLAREAFDCIVFNDVLEHLADPWAVLARIRGHVAPGGTVVASIPNVRYWPVVRDLLREGKWDYAADGVLDRTHLRFFTRSSMRAMFESAGYRVEAQEGIRPGRVPREVRLMAALVCRDAEELAYPQFAVVAKPAAA